MKFDLKQLKKRILQPTLSLMREVGKVYECGTTKDGQVCRYSWRKTGAKILGVAHCDTVNCGSSHAYANQDMVWSSRLDDRLGVFVLLDVLPALGIKTDILLTDFEEQGMSTGQFFEPGDKKYNWMYQFDRSGTDAVHYDYYPMKAHLDEFFEVRHGSFSDISFMTHLGICGCNIGTAYYNPHSLGSYADLNELKIQIIKFYNFYKKLYNKKIPYVKPVSRGWTSGSTYEEKHWWNDENDPVVSKYKGMSIYNNRTNFYH